MVLRNGIPPSMRSEFRGPGPWPYELGQGDSVSRYDSHILWRNPKRVIFNRPPPFSCQLANSIAIAMRSSLIRLVNNQTTALSSIFDKKSVTAIGIEF